MAEIERLQRKKNYVQRETDIIYIIIILFISFIEQLARLINDLWEIKYIKKIQRWNLDVILSRTYEFIMRSDDFEFMPIYYGKEKFFIWNFYRMITHG